MGDIIKDFSKRFLPCIVGFVLMMILILISMSMVTSAKSELDVQKRQLADIQNKIEVKQSAVTNREQKIIMDSTGLDTERVTKDNAVADAFLRSVFTWSNSAEYDNNRFTIANDYGVAEDSYLLTSLLPADIKVEQENGEPLSYIDTHMLNSTFEEMDAYVSGINLGTYSYFTFVTWSVADADGSEGVSEAVMTYDIDADGNISNIMGYTTTMAH